MATKSVQMGCGVPICRPAPKPGVCRCLFGRSTTEELSASTVEARRFLQLNTFEMSNKYDYDFSRDTPNGNSKRWEWQIVRERQQVTETPVVAGLTDDSAIQVDRLQPPSLDVSSEQSTVQCTDSTNVVDIDLAAPLPAEPIPAAADLVISVSSSRSRKRSGGKTLKDYYQVKKQKLAPSPVTIKDIDNSSNSSSDSSISQS